MDQNQMLLLVGAGLVVLYLLKSGYLRPRGQGPAQGGSVPSAAAAVTGPAPVQPTVVTLRHEMAPAAPVVGATIPAAVTAAGPVIHESQILVPFKQYLVPQPPIEVPKPPAAPPPT